MNEIEIHAVKQGYRPEHGIGLFIDKHAQHPCYGGSIVTHLIWEEAKPYVLDKPAPVQLSLQAAQKLMDGLWDCGLRPTEGSGSAGALSAQGEHLKYLQKLVFDHVFETPIPLWTHYGSPWRHCNS